MTGYESKKAAAQDKLKCKCSLSTSLTGDGCQYCNPEYINDDALTIAYQSGYYDGKKAAQPAQEPVAWQWLDSAHFRKKIPKSANKTERSPVYTAPPQRTWVGLTDEDIKAVNAQVSQIPPIDYTTTTYAKAIEAKLKEKNT